MFVNMEEKNNIKINLATIFLIVLIIVIIIMSFFIYKFYTDKQTANRKLESLNNEFIRLQNDKQNADNKLNLLNDKVSELQKIVDDYNKAENHNKIENEKNNEKTNEKNTNNGIIKYELKTSEYFSNKPDTNKYFIDSEAELNEFYSIYSGALNINKDYLKNNSIFIQVDEEGSGSVQNKLSSVTFDNNTVNFIIDSDSPEIGTCDMAFWYFVAIIPNEQLNNLDLSHWVKPSQIK